MKQLYFLRFTFLLLSSIAVFVFTSCKDDDITPVESKLVSEYNAQVPLEWYQLFLEIDRVSPGYRPPAAARMLGYTGLAAYEAAVHGMPEYNSLEFDFSGLILPHPEKNGAYHWPTAVNTAYASMFRFFLSSYKCIRSIKDRSAGKQVQYTLRF